MKQKMWFPLLAAALLAPALHSRAQYNKTFTSDGQKSVDVANASGVSGVFSAVLSTSTNYPVILHKLNFGGVSVGYDFRYANPNPDLQLTPTQLQVTPNGDLIVVGSLYRISTNSGNPFAARFSGTGGTLMWMYEYNSANTRPITEVHICRVEDDPGESYILVTSSPAATIPPPGIFTNTINALRISSSGGLMWNYKYQPPATPIMPLTNTVTDVPETIAYMHPMDGNNRYYIGGRCLMQAGMGSPFIYGFAMGIRKDGSVSDNYLQLPIYNMRSQHAIYDRWNYMTIAYTCTNTQIPTSTSASLIGVAKIDVGSNFLILSESRFYAATGSEESGGMGIWQDQVRDQYVVSCEVHHTNPSPDPFTSCAAMLKLDRASGMSPVFFNKYNYLKHTRNNNIIQLQNGAVENYVMAPALGSGTFGSRVISTDITGDACGFEPTTADLGFVRYLSRDTGIYTRIPSGTGQTSMSLTMSSNNTATNCPFPPGNEDLYKLEATEESTAADIYPTLLQPGQEQVWLDAFSAEAGTIEIGIYSMDGKTVSRQQLQAVAGKNHLEINVNKLGTGNYLLKVQGAQINNTTRLSRL